MRRIRIAEHPLEKLFISVLSPPESVVILIDNRNSKRSPPQLSEKGQPFSPQIIQNKIETFERPILFEFSDSTSHITISITMSGVQTYSLGDWELQSGQSIPNAQIAYKTFGDSKLPAIIYPSWYSGGKCLVFFILTFNAPFVVQLHFYDRSTKLHQYVASFFVLQSMLLTFNL